jgi:hypothetical protein
MSKTRRTPDRKQLAQRMARAFWAAGPLGPGPRGEDVERLVTPMLLAVRRQFPEAGPDDWEAMCREMGRGKNLASPSEKRLVDAAAYALLEEMVTEFLEEAVHQGKVVRSLDPQTGEAVYRNVDKSKGEVK